jgi:hypothetical protein
MWYWIIGIMHAAELLEARLQNQNQYNQSGVQEHDGIALNALYIPDSTEHSTLAPDAIYYQKLNRQELNRQELTGSNHIRLVSSD